MEEGGRVRKGNPWSTITTRVNGVGTESQSLQEPERNREKGRPPSKGTSC